MKEISLDTGLVTYKIKPNMRDENGNPVEPSEGDVVTLVFNPTDVNFLERLYDVFDALDKKQAEYEKEKEKAKTPREIFDFSRKMDNEMRSMLDEALNVSASAALFGGINIYAYSEGLPLWCNLLMALIDEMDASIVRETGKTNSRLEKYTKKYQGKNRK